MTLTWNDYRQWLENEIIGAYIPPTASVPTAASWSTDTRTLKKGDWFIPLSGPNFNGHDYIQKAIDKGAEGFLYSEEIPQNLASKGIRVKNSLKAYQAIARGWRLSLKNLTLVAITGSNGKTTTKEMLLMILSSFGKTYATEENFNNEIGVPKTLLQLTPAMRYAVLEFGARRPGNIKELMEIGLPNISVLLNAGQAHVGVFGSVENLRNTKLEIFRYLRPGGTMISPIDDPLIDQVAKSLPFRRVTFGESREADFRVERKDFNLEHMSLHTSIEHSGEHFVFSMQTPHQINALNAAAALAVTHACQLDLIKSKELLSKFRGVPGRFHVLTKSQYVLVDDAYNANPQSMKSGLISIAGIKGDREVVLFLGDMLELGDSATQEHYKLGQIAATLQPKLLFYTGSFSEPFKSGAIDSGISSNKIRCHTNVDHLLSELSKLNLNSICAKCLIYVKASRGIKLDRVVDTLSNMIS